MQGTNSTANVLYSKLYDEKFQEVEWYKKPHFHQGVKVSLCITFIALIVISSLSAHALRFPQSTLGSFGRSLLGQKGLVACTTTGFTGAGCILIGGPKLLHKTTFHLSDYINENKGFHYVIKDETGTVHGYLDGTFYNLSKTWKGLSQTTLNQLRACEKLVVLNEKLANKKSVDFELINAARDFSLPVTNLMSVMEAVTNIFSLFKDEAMVWRVIRSLESETPALLPTLRQIKVIPQIIERLPIFWQLGEEVAVKECLNNMPFATHLAPFFKKGIHDSNVKWTEAFSQDLINAKDKPIYIAVPFEHLFTFEPLQTTGIVTLLKKKGWSVEKVS